MIRKILNILVLLSLIINVFPYNTQKVSAGFGPPTTLIEFTGNRGLNGIYYGPVKVVLVATGNGIQSTEYTLDDDDNGWLHYTGPFTLSANKGYVIRYRSVDNNGNKEPIQQAKISVKKDTYSPITTPIIQGTKGGQGYYTTAVRIELVAKDTQSGVEYSEYSLNQGESWTNYSVPVEVNGSQSLIYFRSIDRAGNTEKIKKLKLDIDTKGPEIPSINMDPSGWTNGDVTVTIVDGEDAESGTSKSQYRTDVTKNWIDYTSPFKISSEGEIVYARSIDFAGNVSDTNQDTVRINRTSPPAPLLNAYEEWSNEEVLVSIDTNNYGMQRPWLEIKIGVDGSWEEYIDPFVVPDEGITQLYARAIDSAGNISAVSQRTIRYDITPPTAPDKIVISDLKHDELQLSWSGAKDNIEIATYDIYNDQDELLFTTKETTWIYEDLNPYSVYNFKIIARDHADNASKFSELIKVTTPIRPSFSSNESFHVNLKSDSSVWTWGDNYKGQLGDGSNSNRSKAIQVSNLKNIKSVHQGIDFVLAIEKSGTVWGWGGDPINSRKPIKINGFANSRNIKIHNRMIYAFKTDDTVWGWGDIERDSRNSKIPFGNGKVSSINQPEVIKELSNVTTIEFGATHALALTKDGSVLVWGYGQDELFGMGYTGKSQQINTPQVIYSVGKAQKITIAANANFVLKDTGLLYGWGNNMVSQLGLGKEDRRQVVYSPELIPVGVPVKHIETGGHTVFALTKDGSLYSWGVNSIGNAGVGSTENYVYVPTKVNIQSVKRIISTEDKTVGTQAPLMALTRDRQLWAWGLNDPEGEGRLGVGLPEKIINTPKKVLNMEDTDSVQVSPIFVSAVKQDGSIWMWGRKNKFVPNVLVPKEVKFGDEADTTPPTTPQNLKAFSKSVEVDLSWSESIDDNELYNYEIYQNESFLMSTSDTFVTINNLEPSTEYSFTVRAVDISGNVSAMSSPVIVKTKEEVIEHSNVYRLVASEDHSFSIDGEGNMSGWGENTFSLFGDIYGKKNYVSSQINNLPSVTKLARNRYNLVALKDDKTVLELVTNNLERVVKEVKLSNVIDVSIYHDRYALKEDGTVWRWGNDNYRNPQEIKGFYGTRLIEGALAVKANGEVWQLTSDKPFKIPYLENIIDISTYGQKVIALDRNGIVWTGNQGGNFYKVPNIDNIKKVGSGANHFLAIDYSGNVWTWGLNMNGQLGNGKIGAETSTPQLIKQLSNIIDVSGGDKHSLALSEDGSIWSWGDNSKGQLGIGTADMSNVPTKVKTVEKPVTKILKPVGSEDQPTKLSTYDWTIEWVDQNWIYSEDSKQQLRILNQNNEIYYDSGEISKVQNKQVRELVFSEFLPNGRWKIQIREHNGYMWGEWSEDKWIEIEDMKPTVKLVYPIEANNEIVSIQARKPLIKWEQKGGNKTKFVSAQIQILDEKGTVLLDSGEIEQNTSLASGSWTVSEALPVNQKVQVRVRVKDQQLWSDWSKAGWLQVDPNGQPETRKKLSSGGDFTLTIREDGSVWSWGNNAYGQLGDGTKTSKTVAVQASGLTSIVEVSAGSGHVLALKSDGTVWSWGNNAQSQLGDGTVVQQSVAKAVPKLSEVIAVGALQNRSYAVKADGTLWGWGGNLGATPQPMKLTGVVSVTGKHALLSNGTVWSIESSSPYKVASIEDVVTLADSSSSGHTLALKRDGTVWSWGSNGSGQLGNGTTSGSNFPVKVIGLENIRSIGAGGTHSLAVDETGQVWGWGYNIYGQVVIPASSSVNKAVQVGNLSQGVQVAGGTNTSTVLLQSGELWSWGQGGLLGDGTNTQKGVPVPVLWNTAPEVTMTFPAGASETPSLSRVTKPTLGWIQTDVIQTVFSHAQIQILDEKGTVLLDSGEIEQNTSLASGSWTVSEALPVNQKVQVRVRVKDQQLWSDWSKAGWLQVDPNGQPETRKKLSSGGDFTLTIREDGSVWSWGNNAYGQLGDGTKTSKTVAVQASGLTSIVEVSAGSGHVLALKSDGTVWSWGNNAQSQLGDGTVVQQSVAKAVPKLSEVIAVGALQNRSYAVKADGTLWGWGGNLGATPQPMKLTGVVSVTGKHALLSNGTVWSIESSSPYKVASIEDVVTLADSSSSGHTLALKRDGTVWSWGSNGSGQLGNGTTSGSNFPVKVIGLENIRSIGAGGTHSLAVDETGRVWGWGYNIYGQVVIPASSSVNKAVQVGNLSQGVQVAGGTNTSTVLLQSGELWSWGQGGLLGDGTNTQKGVPVPVLWNTAPEVTMTFPAGASETPSLSRVTKPTLGWIQTDVIQTVFSHAQIQILDEKGTVLLDSGEIEQNTSLASGSWTVSEALPVNQKVQVRVRVKDQQLWSDWSKAGWLQVDPNGQPETRKKLSSGGDFTLTIREDGSVWSWGNNAYGQLGDGTKTSKTVAVQASGLTSIVEVSAGSGHVLALKSDGTVWSWGNNAQSQLGDGTVVQQSVAKAVPKLSEVIAVGALQNRSYAVKADGTLWGWGGNLGATPQPMKLTGVVSVTGKHALLSNGTVWSIESSSPYKVASIEDVVTLADSSSSGHTLALKRDGTVWSWGSNGSGQLGNGTTSGSNFPVKVIGLENIRSIGAGGTHSLAVDETGQVWGWGYNIYGQVVIPASSSVNKAVQVGNLSQGVQVAGGTNTSTVLLQSGELWSWGQGGLLGDGTNTQKGVPVPVLWNTAPEVTMTFPAGASETPSLSRVTKPTLGWIQTDVIQTVFSHAQIQILDEKGTVLLDSGEIEQNTSLASGSWTVSEALPVNQKVQVRVRVKDQQLWSDWSKAGWLQVDPNGQPETRKKLSSGGDFTLTIREDGSVWSWGNNAYGQLGDGTKTSKTVAVQASGLTSIVEVSAGSGHVLALKSDGTVWSWGNNAQSQLGDGTVVQQSVAKAVPKLSEVIAVGALQNRSYAVKADGTLWGWGGNLGATPQPMKLTGVVSVTGKHALLSNGTVWSIESSSPYKVASIEDVVTLADSSSSGHTLALKRDGTVWSWGSNGSGQLGNGTTSGSNFPVKVIGLENIRSIGAGGTHSLAVDETGRVWGWGYNIYGQVVIPASSSVNKAVQVGNLSQGVQVAGGTNTSTVLLQSGELWSWGQGGLLGDGTNTQKGVPVQVILPIR